MNLEQIAQTAKPIDLARHEKAVEVRSNLLPFERAQATEEFTPEELESIREILKVCPEARQIDMSFLGKKRVVDGHEFPVFAAFSPYDSEPFTIRYSASTGEVRTAQFNIFGETPLRPGHILSFYSPLKIRMNWVAVILGSVVTIAMSALMVTLQAASPGEMPLGGFMALHLFMCVVCGFGTVKAIMDSRDGRRIEVKATLPKGFILPKEIRNLIRSVYTKATSLYIVTDSCTWTREERKFTRAELDPLLIASVGKKYFLLARFDMTMLENAVASEFTK